MEQTTRFSTSESAPRHIGLCGHRDPHPRGSESIEELESGKGEVVGIIYRNVTKSPEGLWQPLAHNALGATNDLRSGVSPGPRARHHRAELLPKVSDR